MRFLKKLMQVGLAVFFFGLLATSTVFVASKPKKNVASATCIIFFKSFICISSKIKSTHQMKQSYKLYHR